MIQLSQMMRYLLSSRVKTCARTVVVLFALSAFISCQNKTSEPTYVIGVSQDNSDVWHDKMRDEISQEAVLHPELTLVMKNALGDSKLQCEQIDSLVNMGVDLLVVGVENPMDIMEHTNAAFDKGIPIVINSRHPKLDKYTSYVGTDNDAVGQLMAEYLIEHARRMGRTTQQPLQVIEIIGKIGIPAVSERYVSLRKNLMSKHEVQIVATACGNWDYERAYMLVDSLLTLHPETDVIITQNDVMALGAYAAGQHFDPERNFHILGVDALSGPGSGVEAIIEGKIEASITNVSRGDLIVETAGNILHHQPYHHDNSLMPVLVDQSSTKLMMRMAQEMNNESKVIQTLQLKVDGLWGQSAKLRNTNMLLTFLLVLLVLAVLSAIIIYRYRARMLREREQNARVVATQKQQLEQIAAELERVKQSQTMDEQFLAQLQAEIEKHLDDSNYSVDELGAALGVSRAQLFRKVKALTGVTPLMLLKQVRLRKARQLLTSTDMTTQQVAFAVGYTLASYFAKSYKEFFGILPSEERKTNKREKSHKE